MAIVSTVRIYRPDPALTAEMQRCGRCTFSVRRPLATRVAVAVIGDVDATNGRALGHYVERHTGISRQLVLDLRAVDFFGSQGFTALYYVNVQCARRDVDWMIAGGRSVVRILRICDPDADLPIVGDIGSAFARLDHVAKCRHAVAWGE